MNLYKKLGILIIVKIIFLSIFWWFFFSEKTRVDPKMQKSHIFSLEK
jgi:hypothetical protein